MYDNEDNVCGICYNGTSYYFVKNLQGDVISLVVKTKMDEESRYVVVANYTYDAWGKCTVKDAGGVVNTSSDFVGNINPYRYRGYYYDVETGLYYLQSRYYDAEVGRFINGDKLYNSELLIFGNTYYYCNNNPTNCVDVDGDFGLGATSVGTITMLGATNSWNPAGWIFIAVAATILVVGGSGIVIKTANSQTIKKTKRGTNTKILSDVKVKEQNGKPYQLAYVSIFGEIIRVGTPLSFIEALAYLGITGATNTLSQRFQYLPGKSSPAQRKLEHQGTGDWGIYAKSQSAAKALAVVFGFSDKPEIHGNGMYGHYHGGYYDASKDDYVHIFHIWYGGKKILGRQ